LSDITTGLARCFASIVNSGPQLGNVVIHRKHQVKAALII